MTHSAASRVSALPQMRDQLRRLFSGALLASHIIPRRCWPVLGIVAVGIAVTLPALIYGVPYGPDLTAHFRYALSLEEAIHKGDLYPGWLAASNGGYGDPSFRFYPPGLYYFLTAAHALAGDWYAASLLAFTLLTVAGGLCAYFWASAVCPRPWAAWAGVFYMLTAYHVNELYQASLIAEYAGGALFALVLGFTERVYRRGRAPDVAGLAASFAVLALTHLPLTMMAALVLIIYALLRVRERIFRPFSMKLALGVALGSAASACYWATLLAELSWIKGDAVAPGTRYAYSRNFLFWTSSPEGINNWWGNILAVVMILMFWPALMSSARAPQTEKARGRGMGFVKLLLLFSFLMTTPLSWPLWIIIPKLGSIEFPWRWLAVTSLAGSVALASSMPYWKEKFCRKQRSLAMLAVGSVLIAIVFTAMHPIRAASFYPRPQFDAVLQKLPGSASLPEWFPAGSTGPLREMSSPVEAEQRSVRLSSWEDEHRAFEVGPGRATEARVRTLFYPHWIATAGDRTLQTRAAADGALLISLPADAVAVDLQFREPARVHVVAAVSVVGWLLMALLLVAGFYQKSGSKFALENAEAGAT